MKVNGDQTAIQLSAYLKKVQSNRAQAYKNRNRFSVQGKVDQVELSEKARSMQQAAYTLNRAENWIAKRVEQVKMEIEKGTYKVDSVKVAVDMLRESFENNRVFSKIGMHLLTF